MAATPLRHPPLSGTAPARCACAPAGPTTAQERRGRRAWACSRRQGYPGGRREEQEDRGRATLHKGGVFEVRLRSLYFRRKGEFENRDHPLGTVWSVTGAWSRQPKLPPSGSPVPRTWLHLCPVVIKPRPMPSLAKHPDGPALPRVSFPVRAGRGRGPG